MPEVSGIFCFNSNLVKVRSGSATPKCVWMMDILAILGYSREEPCLAFNDGVLIYAVQQLGFLKHVGRKDVTSS